jgi:hypothetical protein
LQLSDLLVSHFVTGILSLDQVGDDQNCNHLLLAKRLWDIVGHHRPREYDEFSADLQTFPAELYPSFHIPHCRQDSDFICRLSIKSALVFHC